MRLYCHGYEIILSFIISYFFYLCDTVFYIDIYRIYPILLFLFY